MADFMFYKFCFYQSIMKSLNSFFALFFFLFFIFCQYSCAGKKAVVKNVYGFYTEQLPGIVMAGENGNELPAKVDTVFVIYLETSSKNISWDSAWSQNQLFSIAPKYLESGRLEAGILRSTGEKLIITTDPGHFLVQLNLNKNKDGLYKAPEFIRPNELLFRGIYKKKIIIWRTMPIKELEAIPAY